MKISEAIQQLNELRAIEGDIDVYLSSDEEGNSHRDLYGIQADWMIEEGTLLSDGISPVAEEDVGTEYDIEDLTRGVVLW